MVAAASTGAAAAAGGSTDVEALWKAVHFENLTCKESCWYAAYDAPFHGQPYRCESPLSRTQLFLAV